MKTMVFLTPADASFGFGLAGVRQFVATPDTLLARILELAEDPSIGVVALDERLIAEPAGDGPLRKIERRWPGLVVVLPSPKRAPRQEDDYALALIRQAIGYQVRVTP